MPQASLIECFRLTQISQLKMNIPQPDLCLRIAGLPSKNLLKLDDCFVMVPKYLMNCPQSCSSIYAFGIQPQRLLHAVQRLFDLTHPADGQTQGIVGKAFIRIECKKFAKTAFRLRKFTQLQMHPSQKIQAFTILRVTQTDAA